MNELLVTYGPDRIVVRFSTRYEAEAAWASITDELVKTDQSHRAMAYAVRSADDPRWSNAPEVGAEYRDVQRKAREAARKARRKELGLTAKLIVAQAPQGMPLNTVILKVQRSMTERGFQLDRWEAQDAVKARVIIGRELRGWNTKRGDGYWVPKKEGPLHALRSPNGHQLGQSTLAYGRGFRRL